MAHQCNVKYKDLTLYAISLYHQQVSNAQSDLIEKCLHSIVLLFNMTKFVPNKEHSRSINFLFSFEENCWNHINYLEKLMVNMLHRKKRVNDDFSVSKLEISMLQTRNTENRPKNTKTWNCKHCWMKMIHKHKNNSQSN